jgi:acetyltransferase-like isoleucine patch superfamily enzyme
MAADSEVFAVKKSMNTTRWSTVLGLPRRAGRALIMALASAQFRAAARVSPSARFVWGAEMTNIRGDRDAIRIGAHTVIAGQLQTFAHGGEIDIGQWCYVGEHARIWSAAGVRIGNRVLISHNVNIHDTNSHPKDAAERHAQYVAILNHGHPRTLPNVPASPIHIEDDAWIGFNTTVLRGVTIGKGAIIGAGSLVLEDVPAHSVYVRDRVVERMPP